MFFAINFRFLSRPAQLKGCQILILNLTSFGRYLDLFLHEDLLINFVQFFISFTKLVFLFTREMMMIIALTLKLQC